VKNKEIEMEGMKIEEVNSAKYLGHNYECGQLNRKRNKCSWQ